MENMELFFKHKARERSFKDDKQESENFPLGLQENNSKSETEPENISLTPEQIEEQYKKAREHGFLAYPKGEAYERTLSRYSSLWIYLEKNGTYSLVRENHYGADRNEKELDKVLSFSGALARANNYLKYIERQQQKKRG